MTTSPPVNREFPGAKYPFLRFQVGVITDKKAANGVWENIFDLIGYGETIEAANKMARIKTPKTPPENEDKN